MKAVLVNVDFLTRVVVDKIYNESNNLTEEFIKAVSLKLAEKLRNNEVEENISMIRDDVEMPYSDNDKPKVDLSLTEDSWYMSSADFIVSNELEPFAKELWGEDIFDEEGYFLAEDDISQIEELIYYLGLSNIYYVYVDNFKNIECDIQLRRYE